MIPFRIFSLNRKHLKLYLVSYFYSNGTFNKGTYVHTVFTKLNRSHYCVTYVRTNERILFVSSPVVSLLHTLMLFHVIFQLILCCCVANVAKLPSRFIVESSSLFG